MREIGKCGWRADSLESDGMEGKEGCNATSAGRQLTVSCSLF
jgi:hypothetical protein